MITNWLFITLRRLIFLGLLLSCAAGTAEPETASTGKPIAVISTDLGDITVELNADAAPKTVANFIAYAKAYHYDLLIFHRVVEGFAIQTGGYEYDLSQREPKREPIVNESANGLKNLRGTLAMARNRDPDSARAQFYINLTDNSHLDAKAHRPGYTVFGKVIEGMDVVDKISTQPVRRVSSSLTHVPEKNIQIVSISVKEATEESK